MLHHSKLPDVATQALPYSTRTMDQDDFLDDPKYSYPYWTYATSFGFLSMFWCMACVPSWWFRKSILIITMPLLLLILVIMSDPSCLDYFLMWDSSLQFKEIFIGNLLPSYLVSGSFYVVMTLMNKKSMAANISFIIISVINFIFEIVFVVYCRVAINYFKREYIIYTTGEVTEEWSFANALANYFYHLFLCKIFFNICGLFYSLLVLKDQIKQKRMDQNQMEMEMIV